MVLNNSRLFSTISMEADSISSEFKGDEATDTEATRHPMTIFATFCSISEVRGSKIGKVRDFQARKKKS